jgi:hypothetical protein
MDEVTMVGMPHRWQQVFHRQRAMIRLMVGHLQQTVQVLVVRLIVHHRPMVPVDNRIGLPLHKPMTLLKEQ